MAYNSPNRLMGKEVRLNPTIDNRQEKEADSCQKSARRKETLFLLDAATIAMNNRNVKHQKSEFC